MSEDEPMLFKNQYPTGPGEGEGIFDLAWIACDRCGTEGTPEVFPFHDPNNPVEMARFTSTLLNFGIDIANNPEHASHVGSVSAGWCCPGCGNVAEFESYTFDDVSRFEY
jgi:hypothetical protein